MDFIDVIKTRRSVRKYLSKDIPNEVLERILLAGQLSPSWKNRQGTRIIVITDPEKLDVLRIASKQDWIQTAPMFIIACITPENSGTNPSGIPYYSVDASIMLHQIILAATNEGLGTCWMGHYDEEPIKKALKIPKDYHVIGMTPLGYPDLTWSPREQQRNPIEDFVYYNEFSC